MASEDAIKAMEKELVKMKEAAAAEAKLKEELAAAKLKDDAAAAAKPAKRSYKRKQ